MNLCVLATEYVLEEVSLLITCVELSLCSSSLRRKAFGTTTLVTWLLNDLKYDDVKALPGELRNLVNPSILERNLGELSKAAIANRRSRELLSK
ncbi:MAG: hypothetical protein JNM27_13635 [Leptospirales bacterium]|nr:hypothetical protein [Leptospirales bacterium]